MQASGVYFAAEVKQQGRSIANDVGDETVNAGTVLGARMGPSSDGAKPCGAHSCAAKSSRVKPTQAR